jgi:hypothetical protein
MRTVRPSTPNWRLLAATGGYWRLLAAVRRTVHEEGGPMPTPAPIDELLDECLAHRDGAGEAPA